MQRINFGRFERLQIRDGEVEELMDTAELVESACAEIVEHTDDRKSVLIFASGVQHGQHEKRTASNADSSVETHPALNAMNCSADSRSANSSFCATSTS